MTVTHKEYALIMESLGDSILTAKEKVDYNISWKSSPLKNKKKKLKVVLLFQSIVNAVRYVRNEDIN